MAGAKIAPKGGGEHRAMLLMLTAALPQTLDHRLTAVSLSRTLHAAKATLLSTSAVL